MSDTKGTDYPYQAIEQLQMSQKRVVMATSALGVLGVATISFLAGRFLFPAETQHTK